MSMKRITYKWTFKGTYKGTYKRTYKGSYKRTYKGTYKGIYTGTYRGAYRGTCSRVGRSVKRSTANYFEVDGQIRPNYFAAFFGQIRPNLFKTARIRPIFCHCSTSSLSCIIREPEAAGSRAQVLTENCKHIC